MWWHDLIRDPSSVAHVVFVVSAAAALGLAIGQINYRKIGLGISGCLFAGLFLGHLGVEIGPEVLEFLKDFGLILFVYTVGLQVGPGFLAALKAQGLKLNCLAAAVILIGAAITVAVHKWGGVPAAAAVGLFSGGSTNTPSLGAAQALLTESLAAGDERLRLPSLGYAVAYPFGILGIILTMLLLKGLFRIRVEAEARAYQDERESKTEPLSSANIEVTNRNLDGLSLSQVPGLSETGVVISRVKKKDGDVQIASLGLKIGVGDIILAVGPREGLRNFELIVGAQTDTDVKSIVSAYSSGRIVVTKKRKSGARLAELESLRETGSVVTRVARADVEFTPTSNLRIQFGDVLTVVGTEEARQRVAEELGNSMRELGYPQIIPVFIGLAAGVLLGAIPFDIPMMSQPVRLGIAGGPLLVAILFSIIRHLGPVVWHLPSSSNLVLREMGIALFLTCTGLKSGGSLGAILLQGPGLHWMAMGALITFVPLATVALFARVVFKMNFMVICGLLSGAMTDPPALAFANTLAQSDGPMVSYATVYPLVMILRILCAQLLVLALL